MRIKIKKLNDLATIPTRGSEYAAGYDLYAALEQPVRIPPKTSVKIGTGLAMAFQKGTFGGIFARSGLATKQGLRPSNCVGVIDSDYRGEVVVALFNDSGNERIILPGDRIAQLIVMDFNELDFEETDELDETERGEGGFGSTGVNDKNKK